MRARTGVPAHQSECTRPGRRSRARTLADWCRHVHTHSGTRASKSSETSSAGTVRHGYAQTLSSPEGLHTYTPAHTCPTQTSPSKGRGDGRLPQKEPQLRHRCFTRPGKAPKGLRPRLRGARACRNPDARARRLEQTGIDIRGTPTPPWCGKEGAETPRCCSEACLRPGEKVLLSLALPAAMRRSRPLCH